MQLSIGKKDNLRHVGTITLYTDRFLLKQYELKDVHDVYENWSSDYDSAKFNAWKVHESESVTKEYVEEWIANYSKLNYYNWAVMDENEVIGSISVSNINNWKKSCEIGYTIAKKRWNEGIATEVLIRILKFLTEEVGFEHVFAMHHIKNTASGRVMEKAGMVYIKNKRLFLLTGNNFLMNCKIYEYKTHQNM